MKQFTANIIPEVSSLTDKFELHRIDDINSDWWNNKPEVETVNNPNILQKLLCRLGVRNYAGDALTNYALADLSTYLSTKYLYCSVGIDGTNGTTYTYTNLISPVMARVATTNALTTTYTTNDTVTYTAVFTADGNYTLKEAGLHVSLAGTTDMGARQTFYDWDITSGENFGGIWKIINNRGV
ncbi:MAG: hypothetical protein WC877_01690 [Dehalococcoidales bacterium]